MKISTIERIDFDEREYELFMDAKNIIDTIAESSSDDGIIYAAHKAQDAIYDLLRYARKVV